MRTKSLIVFSILMFLQVTTTIHAEDEPGCGGILCGLCDPVVLKLEKWATITTYDFLLTTWASCEDITNCCAPINICELYVTQQSTSAGSWSCETGISFGIELPNGFSLGPGFNVSYNGQATVTVEAGVKDTCVLQRCQKSTKKVGPYYRLVMREVQCYKMCFNPRDLFTPCTEYQQPCSNLMGFKKYSTLFYLLCSCKVMGECGIPYYGSSACPQCTDPYNPTCNN